MNFLLTAMPKHIQKQVLFYCTWLSFSFSYILVRVLYCYCFFNVCVVGYIISESHFKMANVM